MLNEIHIKKFFMINFLIVFSLFSQSIIIDRTKEVTVKANSEEVSNAQIFINMFKKVLPDLKIKFEEKEGSNSEKANVFLVYIGRTEKFEKFLKFDNFHEYGYFIKTPDRNTLIIAGKIKTATAYGIYDFFKRFCGYRQFGHTQLYEIFPKKEFIEIPYPLEIKEEPSFDSFAASGFFGVNEFFYRNLRITLPATHNFFNIYPPEKFAKEHPEYYPFSHGKRYIPPDGSIGQWQPCVSNSEVIKIAQNYVKDYIESIGKKEIKVKLTPFMAHYYFERNPYLKGVIMGVNDGAGDCLCEECKKLKEKFNNQYIMFYNQVASFMRENYPDKFLCFIAYGGAYNPPINIKLEPNIFVEITKLRKDLGDNFEIIERWREVGAKKIGIYDYLYGGGYVVPRYYPRIIGEYWKKIYRKYNGDVFPSTIECWTEVWLYDGPKNYILSELAWNIDGNIEALIEDYFSNFYKESAKPMKEFFDRIEEIHRRKKNPYFFVEDWKKISQFEHYTYEDLKFLNEKLFEAQSMAYNSEIKERIRLFSKIWNLSKLFVESYLVYKDLKTIYEIRDPKEIEKVINLAEMGIKKCNEIDEYKLTEEEEKNIFTKTTLEKFVNQRTLRIEPYLEIEIDRIFSKITEYLKKKHNEDFVKSFWLKKIERTSNEKMKIFYYTQLYMLEQKSFENLIANSSFEILIDKKESEFTVDEEKLEWKKISDRLKNWFVWEWPQSEVDFKLDNKEFRSGRFSFSIGENPVAGALLTKIKVSPNERYKVSFWVKKFSNNTANFTIDWQDKEGWLYRKFTKSKRIEIVYPKESENKWCQVSLTFTVPEDAEYCVLIFNAPIQEKGEKINFDDVELIKILDPAFKF
ncbi:MAG: DUF4838 domain-containing protein [Candidatus Omnitrophica bacterium]|nr:DUF4838 domain-containing protein [Candidatus Omnitrophota bacterium]